MMSPEKVGSQAELGFLFSASAGAPGRRGAQRSRTGRSGNTRPRRALPWLSSSHEDGECPQGRRSRTASARGGNPRTRPQHSQGLLHRSRAHWQRARSCATTVVLPEAANIRHVAPLSLRLSRRDAAPGCLELQTACPCARRRPRRADPRRSVRPAFRSATG